MIREACLRVLVLCTIFLKEAAAYGLCLADIGEMMSREFHNSEEEPSEFEVICIETRRLIAEDMTPKAEADGEEIQFDIDYEDGGSDLNPKLAFEDFMADFGFGGVNAFPPLSKLEETIEEEEESEGEELEREFTGDLALERISTISKLSMSLKNANLSDKSHNFPKFSGAKPDYYDLASSSSGHRTANEQLPTSVSFVKLADMNEEEWAMFLEKLQELLYPAFAKRKFVTLGQKQRHRLGASCQFWERCDHHMLLLQSGE